jgi:hypothetical protein
MRAIRPSASIKPSSWRFEFEADAIAPIVEFMGKKPIAVETIADNSIVDRLVPEGFVDKLYKRR